MMRLGMRFIVQPLSIFLTLAALVGQSAGQEKGEMYTLEESIGEAIAQNWSLKAAKEKIDQAISVKNRAGTDFLPKLSMRYGVTRHSEVRLFRSTLTPDEEIAISSQYDCEWRTTVRQSIFSGFASTTSFKLAKLGIDESELEFELSKLDLALKVKEAYFNILISLKAVSVAKQEVKSLESNLEVARKFFKAEMIPVNDVLKAEVELADAKQKLVKAWNSVDRTRAAFNTVLSRPINDSIHVEDILTYRPEAGDFESYASRALERRPEIKILENNVLQADWETKLARSEYYPEIEVTYDYIRAGDTGDVSGSSFHDASRWEAMAVATWTLWEWGKTHYKVSEKKALKRELLKTKASLADEVRLEVKDAFLAMLEAEENIPTTQKAVEQAEENLRVNEERYKARMTTITEVLDAQALLTRARVNYYEALYNHNLARARLERAVGEY